MVPLEYTILNEANSIPKLTSFGLCQPRSDNSFTQREAVDRNVCLLDQAHALFAPGFFVVVVVVVGEIEGQDHRTLSLITLI